MNRLARTWILALAASGGGCAAVPGTAAPAAEPPRAAPVAEPDAAVEQLQVALGRTVSAANGALAVTFLEVVSDSRCPRGETCVWEGDAVLRFALRAGEERATVELHTAAREVRAAGIAGWQVELLALEPAPVSGKPAAAAPVAQLAVRRGDAPGPSLQ